MIVAVLLATAAAPQADAPTQRAAPRALAQAADGEHAQVGREEAIAGAVAWLVEHQRKDGAWGSHHSPRPIEVLADVPGSHDAFRVATTALCVMALADSPLQTEASRAARDRGVDHLLAEADVKRANMMEHYNVWAFGYSLQALGEHLVAHPDDPRAERIRATCRMLLEDLAAYQALDGGWGYLSLQDLKTYKPSFTSMSFTTATCLIGMARARAAGIALPEEVLADALDSVARCETPQAFTYGELWRWSPHRSVNLLKGAACRGPVCYEALALFDHPLRGAPDAAERTERWRHALQALLEDHARFQVVSLRRPIPHESHYAVSGYFYLYGHAYAAYLLERLTDEDHARFAPQLSRAVMVCRQPDGSFWDYPLYSYHKPYGTAFALIALARTAPRDAPPAGAAAD